MEELRLFAACAPGLEPLLRREMAALGVEQPTTVPGGVEMQGPRTLVYRANLQLGLASHVLVRIGSFRCTKLAELVRKTSRTEWESWISPRIPIHVRASSRGSRLYHTGAIAERVRRGIAERLGAAVPAPTADDEGVAIHVRVVDDRCTLSIDTSGAPLHRRGYRQATAKAPLREDLARALLLVSGWDGGRVLVDPFMGSGTLVIEAAAMALGLPPGRLRRFAFMRTPLFDEGAWKRVHDEALAAARASALFPIYGSDRDAGAVEAASANAERAGVREALTLERAPLGRAAALAEPGDRGVVVTNPPRGERIGERKRLVPLYQSFGRVVRALPAGWRVALAVDDRRLALRSGLPLRTEVLTDHGGTKIRLMRSGGAEGFDPRR